MFMTSSKLADRLYELRTKKRVHQKILAEAIGVRPPMYSRREKGERKPKTEQLDVLSDSFGLDRKELRALLLVDRVSDVSATMSKDVIEEAMTILKEEL